MNESFFVRTYEIFSVQNFESPFEGKAKHGKNHFVNFVHKVVYFILYCPIHLKYFCISFFFVSSDY